MAGRARGCCCYCCCGRGGSAPRRESAPQCPSPRAPCARQHEQADAGARRDAVPHQVPQSPGQPPSHLRPPPPAWSTKCPGAAAPCRPRPAAAAAAPLPPNSPPTNRSGIEVLRSEKPTAPRASVSGRTSRRIPNLAAGDRGRTGAAPARRDRRNGRDLRGRAGVIDAFVGEAAAEGSRLRVRGVLVRFQMDWEGWEERTGGGRRKKGGLGNGIVGSCCRL